MSSFKEISAIDAVTTRTLLHEAIPITGSIISGSYVSDFEPENVKDFSHGMFQSTYDYPYLSSSSNHIFDITVGYASDSILSQSTNTQGQKKMNIYNQMAQMLVGYDATNAIQNFDEDGDLTGGNKMKEVFFLNFSRLLVKDEIKKGSFQLDLGVASNYKNPMRERITITDIDAATNYKINSPTGEYGILIASSSATNSPSFPMLQNDTGSLADGQKVGLIFYQAGIAVITGSVFLAASGSESGVTSEEGQGNSSGIAAVPASASIIVRGVPSASTQDTLTLILMDGIGNAITGTINGSAIGSATVIGHASSPSVAGSEAVLGQRINTWLDTNIAASNIDLLVMGDDAVQVLVQGTPGGSGNTTIGGTAVDAGCIAVNRSAQAAITDASASATSATDVKHAALVDLLDNADGTSAYKTFMGGRNTGTKGGFLMPRTTSNTFSDGTTVASSTTWDDIIATSNKKGNGGGDCDMMLQRDTKKHHADNYITNFSAMLSGSAISASADAIRNRIYNVQFNNTIELNSKIYFCRVPHNQFNFSSNPTYVNGSEIRVKGSNTSTPPVTYITTIGLYNDKKQLVAVGKLSEPIRKDPNIELTFRARLDY